TLVEEQAGHQSDPESTTDNQAAVDDALAKLRAVESDARQLRDSHVHDLEELARDRTEWTEKLSEVRGKIEPLEGTLIGQLQKDLKEVSRKYLVSRNVESKLQAKLRKELLACNDLAKERPKEGELARGLADIKKNIARERAEIKSLK
ncbi:hypothetical protein GGI06_005694, partial [Coemansia sp. S85]